MSVSLGLDTRGKIVNRYCALWRCSSAGQSMRLISAESGVQVPAPPPIPLKREIPRESERHTMDYFLTALGLMLIIEGVPYFAFPEKMQSVLREVTELPPEKVRSFGFVSILIGLLICYLVRRVIFT